MHSNSPPHSPKKKIKKQSEKRLSQKKSEKKIKFWGVYLPFENKKNLHIWSPTYVFFDVFFTIWSKNLEKVSGVLLLPLKKRVNKKHAMSYFFSGPFFESKPKTPLTFSRFFDHVVKKTHKNTYVGDLILKFFHF